MCAFYPVTHVVTVNIVYLIFKISVHILSEIMVSGRMDSTMIRVSAKTKEDLKELGRYGDSMDSIIQRLIAHYRKTKGKTK